MARRNKYGAKLTRIDGHLFRSRWEGELYLQLKLLERAGEISGLSATPPKFKLCADYFCERTGKMVKAPTYTPDFYYTDCDGKIVYIDAKGKTLAVNKVKRKIVESRHGVIVWFVYEDGRRE